MTISPAPLPEPTPNEEIARSYFIAMGEGQDWLSLPPAAPFTAPELRLLADLMADATTRSGRFMLETLNGPGDIVTRLRHLLARTWAAGAKSGVAMAHAAATPKDNPLFPSHTHTFLGTEDTDLCITDMFCAVTFADFKRQRHPS